MSSLLRSARDLTISRSREGDEYATFGSVRLNSAFDPRREAERFIVSQVEGEEPSVIVVVGDSLGYLAAAVAGRFPHARLAVLCFHRGLVGTHQHADTWSPDSRESIPSFLARILADEDVAGLKVLTWLPSAAAFPAFADEAASAVRQTVREINGTIMTTGAFGMRWIRNLLANSLSLGRYIGEAQGRLLFNGRAALVAAPGPSLPSSIAEALPFRDDLTIVALPSALPLLASFGIDPDLVVATDPGSWASFHLATLARLRSTVPVAMPLTAARGVWKTQCPVLPLGQGTLFESDLLSSVLPTAPVPADQTGTVAATAIDLLLRLTSGPILLAGLDLQFCDILQHARPHTFDPLWAVAATRLRPEYGTVATQAWMRSRPTTAEGAMSRTSLPLETYRGWIDRHSESFQGRVYRFQPTGDALSSLPAVGAKELSRWVAVQPRATRPSIQAVDSYSLEERAAAIKATLSRWNDDLSLARTATAHADLPGWRGISEALGPRVLEILTYFDQAGIVTVRRALRREGATLARSALFETIERSRDLIAGLSREYLNEQLS